MLYGYLRKLLIALFVLSLLLWGISGTRRHEASRSKELLEKSPLSGDLVSQFSLSISGDVDSRDVSEDAMEFSEDLGLCPNRGHISTDKPRIAILVDDMGNSLAMAREIADLPMPMTWSIIPYLRFSSEVASLAEERNIPYIVHMPMQAMRDGDDGPFLIGVNTSAEVVRFEIRCAFEALPGAVGMNNHRGSRATSDSSTMEIVMSEIENMENKFFVDSRTIAASVAYNIAGKHGIPAVYNSCFIDHEANSAFMRLQFGRTKHIAEKRGWSVAICHGRPATVAFLRELCNSSQDLRGLVTVPELIKIKVDTVRRP